MKNQSKHAQGEEAKLRVQVTVYHIALPHQEEIWREWEPEIEKFLPEVELIFLEFTTILENAERERIERHFNELSQGKVSPYFHPVDFLRPTLSWTTLEEFIHNTGKKIFLERMPEIAGEVYDRHREALREKADLFFKRRYEEAGKKYQEAMELQMKEARERMLSFVRFYG